MGDIPVPSKAARLDLHWAAQAVAAVGNTAAEKQEDFSHTSLTWSAEQQALVGAPVREQGQQGALRLSTLELLWIGDGDVLERTALDGKSLDEAIAWFAEKVGTQLNRPEHDLPESPLAEGAKFGAANDGHAALASWFALAASALAAKHSSEPSASPLRCWPHHFDIAFLIQIDEGGGEEARSIGVGFSPGDGSYDLPYFYVTPWPYPDASVTLPALDGGGYWHKKGWTGAVLDAAHLRESDNKAADVSSAESVNAFLDSAIAAGHSLLEG